MANNHTRVQARKGEVAVSSTTTDSPILPVEQLERLQQIAPHRVDWVFDQTELESAFRRKETKRVNTMVFTERMAGLIFALMLAVVGLGGAMYLAMHDHEITASVIGGTTLVGLVTAFIVGRNRPAK